MSLELPGVSDTGAPARLRSATTPCRCRCCVACWLLCFHADAGRAGRAIREGLAHYSAGEFDKAQDKFAAAREELEKTDSRQGAIAAFNEACAAHRRGETSAGPGAVSESGTGALTGGWPRLPITIWEH